MADNPAVPKQQGPDDTRNLRHEIDALRTRLDAQPDQAKKLAWDTQLLQKKTEGFASERVISSKHPNWKDVLEYIEIGPEGICVSDVRTVDAIHFIAAFAARRRLVMTYGKGSFLLEPRALET